MIFYVVIVHALALCYLWQCRGFLGFIPAAAPAARGPEKREDFNEVLMWLSTSDLQGLVEARHAAVSGVKKVLAMRFRRTEPRASDDQLATFYELMRNDHRLQVNVEAVESEESAVHWIEAPLRSGNRRT